MGVTFSSARLAGAEPAPAAVLPISYAFYSSNQQSLGFDATFSNVAGGGTSSIISPFFTLPLKAGGSTVVACGPPTLTADASATSITCPIANTLIGAGTGTFAFVATRGKASSSDFYAIAFTTQPVTAVTKTVTGKRGSQTWSNASITPGPNVPKSCRLIKKHDDVKDYVRRAERGGSRPANGGGSGYGPPDITYTAGQSVSTATTTITTTVSAGSGGKKEH